MQVFEVIPPRVVTELGGANPEEEATSGGILPRELAAAEMAGLLENRYEIAVGEA